MVDRTFSSFLLTSEVKCPQKNDQHLFSRPFEGGGGGGGGGEKRENKTRQYERCDCLKTICCSALKKLRKNQVKHVVITILS